MPVHLTKTYAQWGNRKKYLFKTYDRLKAIEKAKKQGEAINISRKK